jgi:hypothetical protein
MHFGRETFKRFAMHVEEYIVAIPKAYFLIVNNHWSHGVERNEIVARQTCAPEFVRSLVHMVFTTLARWGRREQNEASGMPTERIDKNRRRRRLEVFRYLKRLHEIELATEIKVIVQIDSGKMV